MNTQQLIEREQEIRKAMDAYPNLEMGEAYEKWKKEKGQEPIMLNTTMTKKIEQARARIIEQSKRVCTQPNCKGTQFLESICSSCVEGRLGFKSKWTCDQCLHRELSKKEMTEWING